MSNIPNRPTEKNINTQMHTTMATSANYNYKRNLPLQIFQKILKDDRTDRIFMCQWRSQRGVQQIHAPPPKLDLLKKDVKSPVNTLRNH